MMLPLDLDALLRHQQHHLGADVLLGVRRGDREVTCLVPNLVAQIRHLVLARVPNAFFAIDTVKRAVGPVIELDIVEDEEFRFRSEKSLVGNAGADQVFFRALGDAARVANVGLQCARLSDGAGQRKGRHGHEWIDEGGVRVGMASMSLASMLFQPRMLEPSKPRPSVKESSLSSLMGRLKCCQVPKVSTNL